MSSATMESSCSPSFLYYNPEQSKQHGQFVSQPPSSKKSAPAQTTTHPNSQPEREVPFPSSLWSQRPAQAKSPQQTFTIHAPTPLLATATLSPDALQKSTGLLTPSSPTTLNGPSGGDFYFYPHTPAHSNTPVSQQWGMDEGCSGTVTPLEIQLPSTPDLWKERSPISPGYQLPMQYMSNCSSPSLMLSSCPSLSPASDHSSSPDIDFCDPRQLTYPSPSMAEFGLSELPKISTSDEDHIFLSEQIHVKLENEDLEGLCLDSPAADDVPAGTINPAALFGGIKRARDDDEEDSWDLDNEEFSDEEDSVLGELSGNALLMPPSPPASDLSRRSSVDPPSKKVKSESVSSDDFELDCIIAEARLRGVDDDVCTDDNGFLSPFSSCHSSDGHHHHHHLTPAPSDSGESGSPSSSSEITSAPVVRRGRKQSLTADPSKTFVCHLCTRRFRRQEHLKRHFRSLHTKDKPFSCPDCGKKFSRSDNLSQHARTHGSATIHITIVDGELVSEDAAGAGEASVESAENSPLGIVLVDTEKLGEAKSAATAAKNVQRRKKKRNE